VLLNSCCRLQQGALIVQTFCILLGSRSTVVLGRVWDGAACAWLGSAILGRCHREKSKGGFRVSEPLTGVLYGILAGAMDVCPPGLRGVWAWR